SGPSRTRCSVWGGAPWSYGREACGDGTSGPGVPSIGRCRTGLAERTPVGGAFPGAVALLGDPDGGAAAPARTASAAVHVEVLAPAAGGGADRALAVEIQQLPGEAGQPRCPVGGELSDGQPRGDAEQEAELALVHVADAGEVALVQQGLADRAVRVLEEVGQRQVRVPVGAEEVGAEVADGPVLVGGAQEFQDGQA